ncbi:MAG TPA: asparagine synthase (glutamine-hydrolyzing) [Candidatus Eisenbacteria bacterium]|nr:asparagine synthase (glutamine-hydrolyzing) [Candidatus Eisenbacteria bacterium]
MCGIAGLFRLDDRIDLGRLGHMSHLLRHRGPHDEGMVLIEPRSGHTVTLGGPDTPAEAYKSPHPYAPGRHHGPADAAHGVGLAHRRLSIVDLSPGGHQPMCGHDARHWITYNGEIYNYIELKAELESMGERFTSASDTEVILAAYRRFGHDAFTRMNGMFAIALWDGETRELICVRDRLGVKPFYYQWDGRTFAFASEPKALVLTQPHRILPRLAAVRDLVALDWVDHEAQTFFEGVWQLPPGQMLGVSERGFWVRRWWTLDPERRAQGSPREWPERFAELFSDAVRLRLRADVEVGSCLSGGIDSSAVVTTASTLASQPLHAFTCAYDEGPAFDERPYVAATVEASGAISHIIVPDGADLWPVLDRLTFQQDEPTAGPGVYSQWKVMGLAHEAGLRVLLDGQGGDETLAGYERYLPLRLRDLLAGGDLPGFARRFGDVARRLGPTHALALTLEAWIPRGLFAPLRRTFGQGKDRVLGPSLRALPGRRALEAPKGFRSAVARQQAFDLQQRLLPSLLRYEDRNSMAFAIETRLPFLDYRMVELAFSLPDEAKLDGNATKAILRRALASRIPKPVLNRRDKMGFETPTDVWLRSRFRNELRHRLLTPGPLHDWIEPEPMRAALDQYLAGRPIGLQVWRWLSLESWARQYLAVDPRVVEKPPRVYMHPGLHLNYEQVMDDVSRELQAQGVQT